MLRVDMPLSKRRQTAWKILVGFVGLATILSLFLPYLY